MIENIRLSEKAKQQLIVIKRKTGIDNWNVLCRWALCLSLKEVSEPPKEEITTDSSIEMTWKVFAGEYQHVYMALFLHRAFINSIDSKDLNDYFKLHIHRGISYLTSVTNSLDGMLKSGF